MEIKSSMFKTTQEAIAAGLKASPAELVHYADMRDLCTKQCERSLGLNLLDEASYLAAQVQFYNEALNAREIVKNHPQLFSCLSP